MSVQIVFSTGNAAFDDSVEQGSFCFEVGRILEEVKIGLETGKDFGRLRDSNGNRVGFWSYKCEIC